MNKSIFQILTVLLAIIRSWLTARIVPIIMSILLEDLRQIKQLNAGWENIVFNYINSTSSTLSNAHKIIFQIGFNNTAFDLDVDWQAMKMFKGIAKD